MPSTFRSALLGRPLDPLRHDTRHALTLVAFLAWVGLGADGLSSSAYGPEEAFKALGPHAHFGLYLALATAVTVFVIAFAYNQVIELFPTGGGGYRVATVLLGAHAGLVSGAALVVDYVLTIAISVAGGVDAAFSMLPPAAQAWKLGAALVLVLLLLWLNLRGARESIRVLLPVFLGFVATHAFLIAYGVGARAYALPALLADTLGETTTLAGDSGWVFTLALLLKAYSLGGGTYTGIEAVSNNVNALAEPRVRTGRVTMLYMAVSLAFTAGGIILLYLLWQAAPVAGQTLNAVAFRAVLVHAGLSGQALAVGLGATLLFEAGLLLVAANTGFLGGPAVLANMAHDSWMPHQFRHLSSRLVTQNGVLLMGGAAAAMLLACSGRVELLVVLYSINVFLTFSLSLLGLCRYWLTHRERAGWLRRLLLSLAGFAVTAGILAVTVVEKFMEGGWVTLLLTGLVVALCLRVRAHYAATRARIAAVNAAFADQPAGPRRDVAPFDPMAPTAVFITGSSRGGGLHALLWVQRMFPGHFRNVVFISARAVDAHAYGAQEALDRLRASATATLDGFVAFSRSHGMPATSRLGFGTDAVDTLTGMCRALGREYPDAVFFTSRLVFGRETLFTRLLHNGAALAIQRRLHDDGLQMVILPMKV